MDLVDPRKCVRFLWIGLLVSLTLPLPAQDDEVPDAAAPAPEPAVTEEKPPEPTPDRITMKDGSLVRGKIVSLTEGKLKVETSWGGTLEVAFDQIQSLESEQAQIFELIDGTRQPGRPTIADDGQLRLETELSGAIDLPLGKVTAINPPPKKPVTYKGNFTLAGRVTDGNTRTKSVGATADFVARGERHRLSMYGNWAYNQDRGDLTARNAKGSMKFDFFVTKKFFTYVNTSFEGDDFADLNLRTTIGGGLGYQFLEEKNVEYYEELGVSFFDEDFDTAPDNRYTAGRVAGRFDWKIVPDRIAFFHRHEFFTGFEDQDDLFADTQSGVRLSIIDNFYANFQINFKWDNTPAPGNRRTDTEYLWGLGYALDI